jgi:hypothetical protein
MNVLLLLLIIDKYLPKLLLLGPSTVRELEGSLSLIRCPIETFGIVAGPSKYKFTSGAIETAGTSRYDIILTDDVNICIDIIHLIAGRLNRFRFSCKYFFIFFLITIIMYNIIKIILK